MEIYKTDQLKPFGVIVEAVEPGSNITQITTDEIRDLVATNRIIVFRGFKALIADEFPRFCSRFGSVLEFDFGVVNELKTSPDAKNYLYTNAAVPFHWDGAFIGKIPSYIFFHCDEAPIAGHGGETLFADTTLMLKSASNEIRTKWSSIEIEYSTEKVVHYGGSFTSPMIANHPKGGAQIIRYAEPVADLNPVYLNIKGIEIGECEAFLSDMHERLRDSRVCYGHAWQEGDVLMADNHTLLHGRREFDGDANRLIRRVNIQ